MDRKSYEDRLVEGLVGLLGKGVDTLEGFCSGLNESNRYGPRGGAWTVDFLMQELKRLGGPGPDENPTLASPALRERMREAARVEPFPPQATTVDELLETGLMNHWYLVARTSDVTDAPVPLRRLSRNLVLWRDGKRTLHVLEDYCPHRGAPLSSGHVVNGDLACIYHGVQLNGEGVVTAVPSTPDSRLVGERCVKSYPCREHAGAIWVYFGDELHPEAPEPIYPEELMDDGWSAFLFSNEWQCNWQHALDNRVDPMHGSFLHAGTYTLSDGRKDAHLVVTETHRGFETVRDNQKNTNVDWHEFVFHPGNIFWVSTLIPYPASLGGGMFKIFGAPTPIDRDSTLSWFFRARNISGWKRDMWRFVYKNYIEIRGFAVAEQARLLQEKMLLPARRREALGEADVAIVRMREMIRAEAQRQIEALAAVAVSQNA